MLTQFKSIWNQKMETPKKTTVSEQALIARINRKLAKEGSKMKRCRENSKDFTTLGYFYTVDLMRNTIEDYNLDLAKYGKELDVLADYEEMED
jgi:hypothetical protein